jgi:SAM-dependent methyltransferase
LGELSRTWESAEALCVLDLGSTSATNIRHFTERGHRIYSEDLLTASTEPELATTDENGAAALDSRKFLADNLVYPAAHFDVVLCWNLPDYLDESLVKPVVGRLWSVLKPGGMLLAFFHTRDAGPDSPCHRFHILGGDTLEMKRIVLRQEARRPPTGTAHGVTSTSDGFQLQRVFNNRHIENLFRDFASIKFFLARDNIREVLVVR